MGLSAEEFEVFAAGGVLQFFDVCIVAKRFISKDENPSKKILQGRAYIRSPN